MPIVIHETINDTWKSNIGPSINPIPSTAFTATLDQAAQVLEVDNQADKAMAGGLVSEQIPFILTAPRYFGMDVVFWLTPSNLARFARGENDLKVTFPGGAQANFSTEWNKTTGNWQLDPTGKKWVDTGYTVTPIAGRNKWQFRGSFDGKVWSVTQLYFNRDIRGPFTPDSRFQNIPAIQTNWAAGLHPQLQTECEVIGYLREEYEVVRVFESDNPIPLFFD